MSIFENLQMGAAWDQSRLQRFIDDGVEEGLSIEYKSAGALSRSDDLKKQEITKDISAMANSAGGTLIYGISEFTEKTKKHLPEKFSPISRSQISKEWLEQIINSGIKPRIDGLVIHPVPLDSGIEHSAYVVEIPASSTAHQAADFRYYKRYNFEVLPMLDHEVRDVMGRRQHPRIRIELSWVAETRVSRPFIPTVMDPGTVEEVWRIVVLAWNDGRMLAQYVRCFLLVPQILLPPKEISQLDSYDHDGTTFCQLHLQNTIRDIVDVTSFGHPKYGPARYIPVLPGLRTQLDDFTTKPRETWSDLSGAEIRWIAYADNAPEVSGAIKLAEIPFLDHRGNHEAVE